MNEYYLERWGEGLANASGTLEELIVLIREQHNSENPRVQRSRWLLSDRYSRACVRFDPFMRSTPYDPLATQEGAALLKRIREALDEGS